MYSSPPIVTRTASSSCSRRVPSAMMLEERQPRREHAEPFLRAVDPLPERLVFRFERHQACRASRSAAPATTPPLALASCSSLSALRVRRRQLASSSATWLSTFSRSATAGRSGTFVRVRHRHSPARKPRVPSPDSQLGLENGEKPDSAWSISVSRSVRSGARKVSLNATLLVPDGSSRPPIITLDHHRLAATRHSRRVTSPPAPPPAPRHQQGEHALGSRGGRQGNKGNGTTRSGVDGYLEPEERSCPGRGIRRERTPRPTTCPVPSRTIQPFPFNLYCSPRNRQSNCGLEPALEVPLSKGSFPVPLQCGGRDARSSPRPVGALRRAASPARAAAERDADLEEPNVGDVIRPVPLDQPYQPGQEPRRR